jgi:hypothetical protein
MIVNQSGFITPLAFVHQYRRNPELNMGCMRCILSRGPQENKHNGAGSGTVVGPCRSSRPPPGATRRTFSHALHSHHMRNAEQFVCVQKASTIGVSLEGVTFVDPHGDDDLALRYAEALVEARKKKALPLEAAKDHLKDHNYFATMMVRCGDADGMVSGAASTTAATIRPALQVRFLLPLPLPSGFLFRYSLHFSSEICLFIHHQLYYYCVILLGAPEMLRCPWERMQLTPPLLVASSLKTGVDLFPPAASSFKIQHPRFSSTETLHAGSPCGVTAMHMPRSSNPTTSHAMEER